MFLQVDQLHKLNFETFGSVDGIPILFIHGGPGLGYSNKDKRFFDPTKHFVIFYDQRGCGKSKPLGSLERNKPVFHIEDIVRLLDHLKISQVHLFGGSWGATLGVLFAAKYPKRVKSLILRGFFSATKSTVDLYLYGRISNPNSNVWARINSLVPKGRQQSIAQYYYERILKDSQTAKNLSYEWARYGLSLSKKEITEAQIDQIMENDEDLRFNVIIELYYALNYFFMDNGYVFSQAELINAPTTIIHGSYDYLCPSKDAELLHSKILGSKLIICNAGHSSTEPEVETALKQAITNYS